MAGLVACWRPRGGDGGLGTAIVEKWKKERRRSEVMVVIW